MLQKKIIEVSDWLKEGTLHKVKASTIKSVFDGDKARFHKHLMRKATPEERWVIRVWLQVSRGNDHAR